MTRVGIILTAILLALGMAVSPAAATQHRIPNVGAVSWELLAPMPSQGMLIGDAVRLTLRQGPDGQLSGLWAEEALPILMPGFALTGHECFGCVKAAMYYGSFHVHGTITGRMVRLYVGSKKLLFSGALGQPWPHAPWIGCIPGETLSALRLWFWWRHRVLAFYPIRDYAGQSVGDYCA